PASRVDGPFNAHPRQVPALGHSDATLSPDPLFIATHHSRARQVPQAPAPNPENDERAIRSICMGIPRMSRRQLLAAGAVAAGAAGAGAEPPRVTPKIEGGIAWYDAREWGAEGKSWS